MFSWSQGTSKRLVLQNPDRTSWAFQTTDRKATSRTQSSELKAVQGISIEDLMRDHGFSHVDLFKIDIEGAERNLFDGPVPWVDCVDLFMIELHDRFVNGCTSKFHQATQDFDLRFQNGDTTVAARSDTITHPV